jgi:hypothetical protein
MKTISTEARLVKSLNARATSGPFLRAQTSYRSFAGNNRLRFTRALVAELDLWLEEILPRGSLASQRKNLIELQYLLNKHRQIAGQPIVPLSVGTTTTNKHKQ